MVTLFPIQLFITYLSIALLGRIDCEASADKQVMLPQLIVSRKVCSGHMELSDILRYDAIVQL